MRSALRVAIALAVAGVAAAFGVFVWPTPYRPVAIRIPVGAEKWQRDVVAARENRFTGKVEYLVIGEPWSDLSSEATPAPPGKGSR
jgi:hypothetical protein